MLIATDSFETVYYFEEITSTWFLEGTRIYSTFQESRGKHKLWDVGTST